MMEFKKIIKEYRTSLGLSQAEFGKLFGVVHATISYWESGKFDIPNKVLEIILPKTKFLSIKCPVCKGTGYIE